MKLLRYFSLLSVSICAFTTFGLHSVSAGMVMDSEVKLKLNHSFVLYSSQQLPYVDANGRTLIPVRLVGDVMGADISWIAKDKNVVISMGKDTVSFVLGANTAIVNGEPKQLDTVSVIMDDTLMVPARFISKVFGIEVSYNQTTNVVQLTDPRILSSERLTPIDEMQNINESFNDMIIPTNVIFSTHPTDDDNNKQIIEVINHSSQTVDKGRLNSNVLFFASKSNISFIGTRGMINMSDNNLVDITPNSVFTDHIKLINTIDDEPIRYVFCNYFVTR